MSLETGFVDANVLVYALDADAPQHAASRALLDAARNETTVLFVTSQVLCEFYSIVTNGKRVLKPKSAEDATRALAALVTFLKVLPVPSDASNKLIDLLGQHPVVGGDIFDLQIVAAMQANGIQRIYTFNERDFAVFPQLTIVIP